MKKRRMLILTVIILGICSTVSIADTVMLEAGRDQCAYSYADAPYVSFYGGASLEVGSLHGGLTPKRLFTGFLQFDLSAYAGRTVTGDAQLQFYARIAPGMAEQPGGFQVRELGLDWVYTEVCWEEYSYLNSWTVSESSYWDKGGWGDTIGLIGDFTVTDHNYVMKTLTIPQATIQGWIDGDSTVSLLLAPTLDGFYADKVINVGAAGAGTPGTPTLTFDCLELTVASVELGNCSYSFSGSGYSSYYNDVHGLDYMSVGNMHGLLNPKQLYAGYMQVDMNDVNNIVEIVGDGILRFEARIQAGHTEQPGGFQIHELNLDYVYTKVCWEEYSYLNEWTDTGSSFWNKGGVGDTNSLIGTFGVIDHNWAPISLNVPESMIQNWVDGTPSSLLFAPTLDGSYAYRVIEVSGDGGSSPYKPILEFYYVAEPACGDYAHPYPVGDVDKNCIVDMHDLAQMAADWLVCTAPECD